jgi:hypothetical protein
VYGRTKGEEREEGKRGKGPSGRGSGERRGVGLEDVWEWPLERAEFE